MRLGSRTILLTSTLVIIVTLFGWLLIGKWIKQGMEPVADGTNAYAIVLGAKVNQTGLSLTLRYRLDAALAYAKEYPHVTLILSGGQGSDEPMSEAEAMQRFLIENGIEESRLLLEDSSTSTYENFLFSTKLLPYYEDSITIISSDFHLARAQKIARNLNLKSDVVAAQTPKIVEAKSNFRERIAFVKTLLVGK